MGDDDSSEEDEIFETLEQFHRRVLEAVLDHVDNREGYTIELLKLLLGYGFESKALAEYAREKKHSKEVVEYCEKNFEGVDEQANEDHEIAPACNTVAQRSLTEAQKDELLEFAKWLEFANSV